MEEILRSMKENEQLRQWKNMSSHIQDSTIMSFEMHNTRNWFDGKIYSGNGNGFFLPCVLLYVYFDHIYCSTIKYLL